MSWCCALLCSAQDAGHTFADKGLQLLLVAAQVPGEVLATNELHPLVLQYGRPPLNAILCTQLVSKLL